MQFKGCSTLVPHMHRQGTESMILEVIVCLQLVYSRETTAFGSYIGKYLRKKTLKILRFSSTSAGVATNEILENKAMEQRR